MVRCWKISSPNTSDISQVTLGADVSLHEMMKETGVIYYQVDPKNYRSDVDAIRRKHGYQREDTIHVHPDVLDNFEEMVAKFHTEHQHPDEEVRFTLEGMGYFDVRTVHDSWIRIEVIPGDFLILPPGIYHRFMFHEKVYGIRFLRLFLDDAPYTISFRHGTTGQQPQVIQSY